MVYGRILVALVCCFLLGGLLASMGGEKPDIVPPVPRDKAAYRGNTNSYKFHKRACRYYSCKNCTAKFATREEAIEAGYRPCGTCDP